MALVLDFSATSTVNKNNVLFDDITGDYNGATNPNGWGVPNPERSDVTVVSLSTTKPNEITPLVTDIFTAPYSFLVTNTRLYVTPTLFGGTVIGTSISAASNTTPIEITTSSAHGLSDNDFISVINVTGNLAANGYWQVTVTGTNTITLNGSTGSGTYLSGGSVVSLSTATDFIDGVWLFAVDATIGGDAYTKSTYYLHTNNIACCIAKKVAQLADNGCKDFTTYSEYQMMLKSAQDAFACGLYNDAQTIIDRLTKLCTCDCGC